MSDKSRREFLKTVGITTAVAGLSTFIPEGRAYSESHTSKHHGKITKENHHGKPNIIFLFSDDQSVPDMGCYGNNVVNTPNLDGLAKEGAIFNRAYVTCPQCSPSRASILTGRSPHAVGATRLHADAFPEFKNIVTMLKEGGYYTGAYRKVHQKLLRKEFDFDGGEEGALSAFFEQRDKEQPFFLWFGSRDPHRPYSDGAFIPAHKPEEVIVPDFLPDTIEVRKDLAHYYDEIARFDKECGDILAIVNEKGLAENTMIVMAGDNGMPFPRAKATLYEPGINVPLIIKWPKGIKAGMVSDELVSLVDLYATWLEMAGIDVPKTFEGISLLPHITGNMESIPRDFIFVERNWHDNWSPMRGVVTKDYKLIQNYRYEAGYLPSLDLLESPSFQEIKRLGNAGQLDGRLTWYLSSALPLTELYDLRSDHGEWINLADKESYKSVKEDLENAVSKWMFDTNDFLPPLRGSFPPEYPQYVNINPINGGVDWPPKK